MLSLTPTQKVALGLVVVLLLAAGALYTVARLRAGGSAEDAVTWTAPEPTRTTLCVHVVGAVNRPGLYRLRVGSRVQDAIALAGGFAPGARTSSVNLAAFVDDGQQVFVQASQRSQSPEPTRSAPPPSSGQTQPRAHMVGAAAAEPAPAPATARTTQPTRQAAAATPAPATTRVCINTAGLLELQQLPGIGPELAQRILYYRHEHGRFRSFEQLKNVDGIGELTVEKVRRSATLN